MSKKLAKSFGYKAVHITVLMLYSLLLIPVLLNYWDLEVYGAWIALYAFFNLIQVMELGHSTYVGNEINRIVHTNKQEAKNVLGSALRANLIVGSVQLLIVVLIYKAGLLGYLLDKEIDDTQVAKVLGILFVYRMSIGSFRGVIVKTLNPYGLIYKSFQFSLTEKIIEFFILVTAAVSKISLVELALLWLFVKTAYSVIILFQLKRLLPEFFPWWRYGSFSQGLGNLKRSLSFAASNFLDRLGNDGIVLVVSVLVGTTFLPLFSATRTLVNFGLKLSDFFLNPLTPEIINLYAKNKLKVIQNIFKTYWFLTGTILIAGFTASLFFITAIFNIWTNGKLEFSMFLYCSLVVIFLVQNYGKVMLAFFTAINNTQAVLVASIIRICIFFGVTIALKQQGLTAVLIGLIAAELVVVSLWLPTNIFKQFDLKLKQKAQFYLNLITVVIVAGLYYFNYSQASILIQLLFLFVIIGLLVFQFFLIDAGMRENVIGRLKRMAKIKSK